MSDSECALGSNPTSLGTDWIPTDPSVYDTSNHFESRANNQDRAIDHEVATQAISKGDVSPLDDRDGWKFTHRIEGLTLTVICSTREELVPFAHTGYAIDIDESVAEDSPRWTDRQLTCERFRRIVYSDDWSDLRQMMVATPIHIEGHAMVSVRGKRYIDCMQCDERFTATEHFVRADCTK